MKIPLQAVGAVLAVALASQAAAQTKSGETTDHSTMHHGTASDAYMDSMAKMDDAMAGMKMTGQPGIDFAASMIPHHQAAIDMAKAYLASGEGDAELTKMSNEIIAAQEREIAVLKAWLARHPQ